MKDLTPLQVMFIVLFVVGSISQVVLVILFLMSYVRMGALTGIIADVLNISAATNVDTRRKVDRIEEVAEKVEDAATKATKEVTIKVEEVRKIVSDMPKTDSWKPGDPDRRKANNPGDSSLGWLLGPAMLITGIATSIAASNIPEAADTYQSSNSIPMTHNTNTDSRLETACHLMRSGNYPAAIEAFTVALNSGADVEVCLACRAECEFYMGNYVGVRNDSDELDKKKPNSPWPHYLRGLVAKKRGETRQAKEHFHTSTVLGHPLASYQLEKLNHAKR